jgi:hypothetical protein
MGFFFQNFGFFFSKVPNHLKGDEFCRAKQRRSASSKANTAFQQSAVTVSYSAHRSVALILQDFSFYNGRSWSKVRISETEDEEGEKRRLPKPETMMRAKKMVCKQFYVFLF